MQLLRDLWGRVIGAGGRWRWLAVTGVVGIVLIGLSECKQNIPTAEKDSSTSLTIQQVETAMEERVTTLLSHIDGAGNCHVMVTLEQGAQQVYASESVASGEKVLTVSTDEGPIGLLITEIQPIIKGVVVVCDGGADESVRERVTAAIATAFNLSSRRVCVLT